MTAGQIGCMATPAQSHRINPDWTWAADNGCFSDTWQAGPWLRWLDRQPRTALFAVVPDVYADPDATDRLWERWAPAVRQLGYRCAYVTQDGCTAVPDDADVIFTGGTTAWKLSLEARALLDSRPAHMGRVNTLRRLRVAYRDGYDTVDGTFLTYGPDTNLPRLLRYLKAASHPTLEGIH
jgi:hypothetical protein